MAKIKGLMPSLKEKKRYIAFEAIAETDITNFSEETLKEVTKFMGEFGMAQAGIIPIPVQRGGLWRVNHNFINQTKAGLTMVTHLSGKQIVLRSLGVSGLLKKAQGYLVR